MASTITPKLNLSLPPRRINGVPLNIFNDDTDFKNDDDVRFVNADGDVMTGDLSVPSLIITGSTPLTVPSLVSSGAVTAQSLVITGNQAISLPSVYSSLPTSLQVGGIITNTLTTAMVAGFNYSTRTYAQISVPAGCYIVTYSFTTTNNLLSTPRPNITVTNFQGGVSLSSNTAPLNDFITVQYYNQLIGSNNSVVLGGTGIYRHISSTNVILYANCYISTSSGQGDCNVTGAITALRVG